MNLKQLSILIVLVALIGGSGLYLYQKKTAAWQPEVRLNTKKLLGDFPLNDVAQVVVKANKAELNLVKQDDLWKVKERYNYPANFSEISEFLRKSWELKGIQQLSKVGQSQLPRLELAPPGQGTNSGTMVEFKDKSGKLIRSLQLGKKHQRQSGESASPFGGDMGGWPDGRFILVATNGPANLDVWIVSEPFSNIEPKPESWLNKDFFKVEKLRSVSVTSTNATNAWKLTRETEGGELKLADRKAGEELDSSKASGAGYLLSSPSFTDVLSPDTKPETIGMDKPMEAVLETFDNFVYTIEIGRQTNDDNYPMRFKLTADLPKERVAGKDEKPEDKTKLDKEFKDKQDKLKEKLNQEKAYEKWTYLVSKWTIDTLLKPRSELLAPPKEPKKDEAKPDDKKDQPKLEELKKEDPSTSVLNPLKADSQPLVLKPLESAPATTNKAEAKPADSKDAVKKPEPLKETPGKESPKSEAPKKDEPTALVKPAEPTPAATNKAEAKPADSNKDAVKKPEPPKETTSAPPTPTSPPKPEAPKSEPK